MKRIQVKKEFDTNIAATGDIESAIAILKSRRMKPPEAPQEAGVKKQKTATPESINTKNKLNEALDNQLTLAKSMLKIVKENKNNKTNMIKKINSLIESTSGSTTAGFIASIPGAGGPLMPMIRRMPAGQSFFGPAGTLPPAKPKTKKKKTKTH